jgi:nitrous oxide reductase accessory protein NosL
MNTNQIVVSIETHREIFGNNCFPIVFASGRDMVKWLMIPDNHKLIKRIRAIYDRSDRARTINQRTN